MIWIAACWGLFVLSAGWLGWNLKHGADSVHHTGSWIVDYSERDIEIIDGARYE